MSIYVLGVRTPAGPATPGRQITPVPATWSGAKVSSSVGEVYLAGDVDILLELTGLGPAPRSANFATALGLPGQQAVRQRPVIDDARRIVGPLHIRGADARERADTQAALLSVLCPPDDSPVTFSLFRGEKAVSTEGWAQFEQGSWEAAAAYDEVAIVQLDLACPSPYWLGEQKSWIFAPDSSAAFFPILPVALAPTRTFGVGSTLVTDGDVPAWPEVRWLGPGTTLTFTTSRGTWEIDATADPLGSGETAVVRTDPASGLAGDLRVEGPGGESWWKYLTQRGLRPLTPGEEQVQVDVTGGDANTRVEVLWRPVWRDIP